MAEFPPMNLTEKTVAAGGLGAAPIPTFMAELPLVREAYAYAREMHRSQRRDSDAATFILRPLEVAALLYNTGHSESVVAAGVLHDTVEDTSSSEQNLTERFGSEVADVVAALTEDSDISGFAPRKSALREQVADYGDGAIAVYAADKVTKVRELRSDAAREPGVLQESPERLEHYRQSLIMLEEKRPDHPLVRQLRFELEMLRALPPRASSAED